MTKKEFDFFPCEFSRFSFPEAQTTGAFLVLESTFSELAEKAFERLSFTFTREHLKDLITIALASDSGENDRYVAATLLENAQIASHGVFALCQDTGIANVFGWKDAQVFCIEEQKAIEKGILNAYLKKNLRFSTVCPSSFFEEYDPHNNLPAQILLFQNGNAGLTTKSNRFTEKPCYQFLFCAKGGGSSNKTTFIQGTKAILNETAFENLLKTQISKLGTAACPPYTIAIIVGGLSPEHNMLTLKLATCGFYDSLSAHTQKITDYDESDDIPFRETYWENRVLDIAKKTGFGAQFGGTALALKAIVLRLPRHGASCPVSIGVSCSAHRNLAGYITEEGYYLEKTCENPTALPRFKEAVLKKIRGETDAVKVDTSNGIEHCLKTMSNARPGSKFLLSGKVIVARDQAHAKWKALIDNGKPLPDYCIKYPIFYAGPAETPPDTLLGSFGPTTAGRMDSYADLLMSRRAALVTLAKGNRSIEWTHSCKKYGAVYLGVIGGAAALIACKHIVSAKIIDYPELGMEAVRLVDVRELPVFMLTNANGEDFYELIAQGQTPL